MVTRSDPSFASMRRANLLSVKTIRICLLLLLAVLLPVRGAVAAAMLCPVGGTGTQSEVRVDLAASGDRDDAAARHEAGHRHAVDAPGASHEAHDGHDAHDPGHHPDDPSDHADKCNLCAAFCSVTSMPSGTSIVLLSQVDSALRFPAVSAPSPSFVSDGLERPPRSI